MRQAHPRGAGLNSVRRGIGGAGSLKTGSLRHLCGNLGLRPEGKGNQSLVLFAPCPAAVARCPCPGRSAGRTRHAGGGQGLQHRRHRHHAAQGLLRHRLRRQDRPRPADGGAPDGTVFVNTWSGVYYSNDTPPDGGFLVALKDTKGTGKADARRALRPDVRRRRQGRHRHLVYKDWVYAELNDKIVRYALKAARSRRRREAGDSPQRHADHRRSPDASVHHRRTATCSSPWARRRTHAR